MPFFDHFDHFSKSKMCEAKSKISKIGCLVMNCLQICNMPRLKRSVWVLTSFRLFLPIFGHFWPSTKFVRWAQNTYLLKVFLLWRSVDRQAIFPCLSDMCSYGLVLAVYVIWHFILLSQSLTLTILKVNRQEHTLQAESYQTLCHMPMANLIYG